EARHNIIYDIRLATTRGVIRDAQGKVLAASRPSYNVYVVPARLDMKDTWNTLVDYLRLSADEKTRLEEKLQQIRADAGAPQGAKLRRGRQTRCRRRRARLGELPAGHAWLGESRGGRARCPPQRS